MVSISGKTLYSILYQAELVNSNVYMILRLRRVYIYVLRIGPVILYTIRMLRLEFAYGLQNDNTFVLVDYPGDLCCVDF